MKIFRTKVSGNCHCYWALFNTEMLLHWQKPYSKEHRASHFFCVCNLSIEQNRWNNLWGQIALLNKNLSTEVTVCPTFPTYFPFSPEIHQVLLLFTHVWQRWDICHSIAYSCTSNPKYQCSCVWESRLWNSWNNDVFGSWKKKKNPIGPNVFHCNMNK